MNQDSLYIPQERVDAVLKDIAELNNIYEEYRKIDCPDNAIRCKVDKCNLVSRHVLYNAGFRRRALWPEVSSVFDSTDSDIS